MKSPKLKPLFGFRPGIYLTALAALILLLVLFVLLVLPGMLNNGTLVSFTSDPPGAAVFADGIYIGSTPFTAFIKKGTRTVRMEKPYFSSHESVHEVGGRVFFTLVAKRKGDLHETLALEDAKGYFSWRLQDIYSWSLVTNFTAAYQYPDVASRTAADLAGIGPSPYLDEFVSLLPYLASSSPVQKDIRESLQQFASSAAEDALRLLDEGIPETPVPDAMLNGHTVYDELGITVAWYETEDLGSFALSTRLIPATLYDSFIEAVPEWGGTHKQNLISRGLVDDTYLQSAAVPGDIVTNISAHAARAFAAWLSDQIAGYSAHIPGELHLLSAAEAGGLEQNSWAWQWSASPFYPGYQKPTDAVPQLLDLESNYVVIKDTTSGRGERGALPPQACSPITGLRLMFIKD